jgi:hypothetical protein
MAQLKIAVVFKKSGTASVGIIPSAFPQWEPEKTSDLIKKINTGDYLITWVTLTQGGGSIKVLLDGEEKCSQELAAGDDGGNCTISVPKTA